MPTFLQTAVNETGWNKEKLKSGYIVHHFRPNQILSGSDWNAEVSKKCQELLDQHNLYNNAKNKENSKQLHLNSNHNINSVKISYSSKGL